MKYICDECSSKTPVKSIQVERNLCRDCCEYTSGYTIPECPNCNYDVDMMRMDDDLYICPKCGLCRSSREEHLTHKQNPGSICPVLGKKMDFSDLERSHWFYEESPGHEESYIRISREAHTKLHDHSRLLLQERKMKNKCNSMEVIIENLMKLDLQRISSHHPYHPYNAGVLHLDYILTRYAFPEFVDSQVLADIFGYEHPGYIPDDLIKSRKDFSKERKKYFN